jgi:hypothetical protein
MSLGKIIVLLLGLAIVAFAVKTELAGTATGNPNDPTQAKRQLDSVRNRTDEISKEQQKRADDVAEKAGGN